MAVWDLVLKTGFQGEFVHVSLMGHVTAVFSHSFTAASSSMIALSSQPNKRLKSKSPAALNAEHQ
jgi:hypothetical protein